MKRRRPDEERDKDLYFDDGNVIISASTPGGDLKYFRVHNSMLSKQSIVFKDMLSMPSPSEVDTYDGLPLVHVHDDVKELKQFLQAIYDPRKAISTFLAGQTSLIPDELQFSPILTIGSRYASSSVGSFQTGKEIPGGRFEKPYHGSSCRRVSDYP